jgi:hypothetical protein
MGYRIVAWRFLSLENKLRIIGEARIPGAAAAAVAQPAGVHSGAE